MINILKYIIKAIVNGIPLYVKIFCWNKIRLPLINKIENIFIFSLPNSKYTIMVFYNYLSNINTQVVKFYWEELQRFNFWNEIRFFIIYLPLSFILGILKKNILYFRIFWILITDFLIFGIKGTLKQKKWHLVFKHFFYTLIFMQFLYFLNISLVFKFFIFSFAIYGNWKEYFKDMQYEKDKGLYKNDFEGWIIYGIRSLIGFFVEDYTLLRRCQALMKNGNKEFSKLWWLHNKYFALELYFWKKEIEINIKKLKHGKNK